MNAFTKLTNANVALYNAHPTLHTAFTVVYAVGSLVAINKMAKKIAGVEDLARN